MRYILLVFLIFSSLNSSILLDKSYPLCIEDYYISSGSLYYLKSSNNKWGSTTANNSVNEIHYGYDFNSTSGNCSPKSYMIDLGLSYFDYHFLLSISGILFSTILFFIISSFLVGL